MMKSPSRRSSPHLSSSIEKAISSAAPISSPRSSSSNATIKGPQGLPSCSSVRSDPYPPPRPRSGSIASTQCTTVLPSRQLRSARTMASRDTLQSDDVRAAHSGHNSSTGVRSIHRATLETESLFKKVPSFLIP